MSPLSWTHGLTRACSCGDGRSARVKVERHANSYDFDLELAHSSSAHMAKPNSGEGGEWTLFLVGGSVKSHGKGHEYRKWWNFGTKIHSTTT